MAFRRLHWVIVALVLSGLGVPVDAYAWWNDDWAFRKEISLDAGATGAAITEDVAFAPVLVRLSIANFPFFADAKPDGSDLRVVAGDDQTTLGFHIEKYDAQAQIALLWVNYPALSANANTGKFYLYYGNPEAASAANSADSYDPSQALVYHFAAADGAQDVTSYKVEPTALIGEHNPASLIGSGLRMTGTQLTAVPNGASLRVAPAGGYTISAWVRPEGAQQSVAVAAYDASHELSIGVQGEVAVARWKGGGQDVVVRQPSGTLVGEWHHVALRATGSTLALFVDGVQVAQGDAILQEFPAALSIGGAGAVASFRGDVDELQVAGTARSDSWIRAAALSQGMIAPLVIYGGDAQKDGEGGESHFASTLKAVTIDGWVIIAVLGVMFIFSLGIMVVKLLFLQRVASGNAKFLEEFHQLREDPAALAKNSGEASDAGKFGISTLWQLYRGGIGEAMKRVNGLARIGEGTPSLSPQAIESIRATLDATLTRTTQRLQSQMVWLTISIAGGPFLGLLGTVVGVMIVFAGIAASGDVNVNAIAPGTAAALVATVAGLGVAIPCLFGYNYLNTRIKDIVADMRVFNDEFVARIAEKYS
jgi:biopolymer transport protein ExbB